MGVFQKRNGKKLIAAAKAGDIEGVKKYLAKDVTAEAIDQAAEEAARATPVNPDIVNYLGALISSNVSGVVIMALTDQDNWERAYDLISEWNVEQDEYFDAFVRKAADSNEWGIVSSLILDEKKFSPQTYDYLAVKAVDRDEWSIVQEVIEKSSLGNEALKHVLIKGTQNIKLGEPVLEILKGLLEKGAPVEVRDEMASILIEMDSGTNYAPIKEKCKKQLFGQLANKGISQDVRESIAIKALARGEIDMVLRLIELGLGRETNGVLAVSAAKAKKREVVSLALIAGIPEDVLNGALTDAVVESRDFGLFQSLLYSDVGQDARDKLALQAATQYEGWSVARSFIQKGVSDAALQRIFIITLDKGDWDAVESLIDGYEIGPKERGCALEEAAAKAGKQGIVQKLMAQGDIESVYLKEALKNAAESGNTDSAATILYALEKAYPERKDLRAAFKEATAGIAEDSVSVGIRALFREQGFWRNPNESAIINAVRTAEEMLEDTDFDALADDIKGKAAQTAVGVVKAVDEIAKKAANDPGAAVKKAAEEGKKLGRKGLAEIVKRFPRP